MGHEDSVAPFVSAMAFDGRCALTRRVARRSNAPGIFVSRALRARFPDDGWQSGNGALSSGRVSLPIFALFSASDRRVGRSRSHHGGLLKSSSLRSYPSMPRHSLRCPLTAAQGCFCSAGCSLVSLPDQSPRTFVAVHSRAKCAACRNLNRHFTTNLTKGTRKALEIQSPSRMQVAQPPSAGGPSAT